MALLTRRGMVAASATVWLAAALGKPARAGDVPMRPLSDIVPSQPPRALPAVRFTTLDGATKTLADFAGRPLVLNFWATWCVPCVAELPELDKLAAQGRFAVLAVSADRGGAAAVKPFMAAHGITNATVLLDTGNEAVQALGVVGFPTTLVIGADGRLRGTLEGPAAWSAASEALNKLVSK